MTDALKEATLQIINDRIERAAFRVGRGVLGPRAFGTGARNPTSWNDKCLSKSTTESAEKASTYRRRRR